MRLPQHGNLQRGTGKSAAQRRITIPTAVCIRCVCIFPVRADKGTALRLVAGKLDIPLGQVLAIGDNPNDMPMFAAAGTSVAMGNAPPEVKDSATVVGPTNDDEGVAWAVRRFVLGGGN